jgi:hypothetical protein
VKAGIIEAWNAGMMGKGEVRGRSKQMLGTGFQVLDPWFWAILLNSVFCLLYSSVIIAEFQYPLIPSRTLD